MLYTLVRKTKTDGGEFSKSETFSSLADAIPKFFLYLSNNSDDKTVKRFDITILNGDLIPCKTEHFIREEVTEEVTEGEVEISEL